ncbi:MAG: hypothetical protein N3E50_05265 [Candidatus Goldbacteria bacterium]|nr:hypothetical protein [Candidatus Goldiibacteriota bacterium]
MKKILILLVIVNLTSILFTQEINEIKQGGNTINIQAKKKLYLQTGAIESFEGNKYVLRKISSKIEFFINDATLILLKKPGVFSDIKEKNYLVIKGPHNKNTILANSVYIYKDKEEYNLFLDDSKTLEVQTKYSFQLEGFVKQTEPFLIIMVDGKEYIVSYDEDTNFITNKIGKKDDIKIGDSATLYFDKIISIRYDNYPVKMIISKIRAE